LKDQLVIMYEIFKSLVEKGEYTFEEATDSLLLARSIRYVSDCGYVPVVEGQKLIVKKK